MHRGEISACVRAVRHEPRRPSRNSCQRAHICPKISRRYAPGSHQKQSKRPQSFRRYAPEPCEWCKKAQSFRRCAPGDPQIAFSAPLRGLRAHMDAMSQNADIPARRRRGIDLGYRAVPARAGPVRVRAWSIRRFSRCELPENDARAPQCLWHSRGVRIAVRSLKIHSRETPDA